VKIVHYYHIDAYLVERLVGRTSSASSGGGAYYKLAVDGGREVDAQTTTALYADDYWFVRRPILVAPQTYIRLLLRVGIKVVDEWYVALISTYVDIWIYVPGL